MTKITKNGLSTTQTPGQEQYEFFTPRGHVNEFCQYDYRHTNGRLFSIVRPTLDECRAKRDEWLTKNNY